MKCISLLVLAACAIRAHVPDQFEGRIPLVVANLTQDNACKLRVSAAPTPADRGDNWLGMVGISSNNRVEFTVKPGTYNMWVHGCGDMWDGVVENVAINGPTFVGFGGVFRASPPEGYHAVFMSMQQHFILAPTCAGHACP